MPPSFDQPDAPEADRTVRIDGIGRSVTDEMLYDAFVEIGHVLGVSFHFTRGAETGYATAVFARLADARKAPTISGRTLGGYTLAVSLPPPSAPRRAGMLPAPAPALDDEPRNRKNLYALNLPMQFTTEEFRELFEPFGEVTHAVILAMSDTYSRRRGFIDMATPEQAAAAIKGLTGTAVKSYIIEVSYALVQRSGGPMDDAGRFPSRPMKQRIPVISRRGSREKLTSVSTSSPLNTADAWHGNAGGVPYYLSNAATPAVAGADPSSPSRSRFNPYAAPFHPTSKRSFAGGSLGPRHVSTPESMLNPRADSFAGMRRSSAPVAMGGAGAEPAGPSSSPLLQPSASKEAVAAVAPITLIIKNLPAEVFQTDIQLEWLFHQVGPVGSIRASLYRAPDGLPAAGMVTFQLPSDAENAIFALNGRAINGRIIEVDHSAKVFRAAAAAHAQHTHPSAGAFAGLPQQQPLAYHHPQQGVPLSTAPLAPHPVAPPSSPPLRRSASALVHRSPRRGGSTSSRRPFPPTNENAPAVIPPFRKSPGGRKPPLVRSTTLPSAPESPTPKFPPRGVPIGLMMLDGSPSPHHQQQQTPGPPGARVDIHMSPEKAAALSTPFSFALDTSLSSNMSWVEDVGSPRVLGGTPVSRSPHRRIPTPVGVRSSRKRARVFGTVGGEGDEDVEMEIDEESQAGYDSPTPNRASASFMAKSLSLGSLSLSDAQPK